MRALTVIAAALLCLSLLPACQRELPRARPIPEFNLPPIDPAALPKELQMDRTRADGDWMSPSSTVSGWVIGFNYALGWEPLIRHVEGQLRPMGYVDYTGPEFKHLPKVPGVKPGQMIRAYQSADDKYIVIIGNMSIAKNHGYTTGMPWEVGDYFAAIDYTVAEAKRLGINIVQ
jgi:hypothetical protein